MTQDPTPELHRAKTAYEAYADSTGGKTFDGRDMPLWAALGPRIQRAWEAAAQAAVDAFRTSEGKDKDA